MSAGKVGFLASAELGKFVLRSQVGVERASSAARIGLATWFRDPLQMMLLLSLCAAAGASPLPQLHPHCKEPATPAKGCVAVRGVWRQGVEGSSDRLAQSML